MPQIHRAARLVPRHGIDVQAIDVLELDTPSGGDDDQTARVPVERNLAHVLKVALHSSAWILEVAISLSRHGLGPRFGGFRFGNPRADAEWRSRPSGL
jgi:hypothetical protein